MISVRQAAIKYDVTKSTIRRKLDLFCVQPIKVIREGVNSVPYYDEVEVANVMTSKRKPYALRMNVVQEPKRSNQLDNELCQNFLRGRL